MADIMRMRKFLMPNFCFSFKIQLYLGTALFQICEFVHAQIWLIYIKNENFRTEKLSDSFLSENLSVRNLGLPKVFPSENFRFSAILLKSLKTLINIVGLIIL